LLDGDDHTKAVANAFGPKVPVRRGGPWHGDGTEWEDWYRGEFHTRNPHGHPYRARKGVLEFLYKRGVWRKRGVWCKAQMVDGLNGIEIRTPRGYTGPVPEGCVWVEEKKDELWHCEECGRLYSPLVVSLSIVKPCSCGGKIVCVSNEGKVPINLSKTKFKFSVSNRIRVTNPHAAYHKRTGTVVKVTHTDGDPYTVCTVHLDRHLQVTFASYSLEILPASEDPLPRKAGVVIYEVTKEKFDNVCAHRAGDSTFSASRIDGCRWSTGSSSEYFLKSAVAGETWIVCREK